MLLLSLVRGAMAFGPQHAIAEFRLFVAFVAGALYFATFAPSSRLNDRIGQMWLALSIPMMILVCLRWLDTFAGINLGVPAAEFGEDAAIKVLNGPYTFFLADTVILTVPFWQLHGPPLEAADVARRAAPAVRGAVEPAHGLAHDRSSGWQSSWCGDAASAAGWSRWSSAPSCSPIAGYVALGGSEGEEQTVARSAVGTGTLDWRIEGWSELLDGLSTDPVQWGIGEPMGSDFTREVQGSEVEAEPHNFYLAILLRAGVVGLLALIALTGGLLRALWRIPPPGGEGGLLASGVFPALLAMQVVWFIAWKPGMEQGIITGLAVGLAACSRGGVRVVRARPPSLISGGGLSCGRANSTEWCTDRVGSSRTGKERRPLEIST